MITNVSSKPFNLKGNGEKPLWYMWRETCDVCGHVIQTEYGIQSSSPPDLSSRSACLKCMLAYMDADLDKEFGAYLRKETDTFPPLSYDEEG